MCATILIRESLEGGMVVNGGTGIHNGDPDDDGAAILVHRVSHFEVRYLYVCIAAD